MNLKNWIAACMTGILSAGCGSSDIETPESTPAENNEEQITDWNSYTYEIPVIFHVLYADRNQAAQYISATRLENILKAVNKFYAGSGEGSNLNVTFTLAQTDEKGKALSTPGVEYIQWEEDYPIAYSDFMTNNENKYTRYIWDPNQYINVMMYPFKSDNERYTTLGISHMPYTTKGSHSLEGLTQIEQTTLKKGNLMYPYCVSINSLYIDEESTDQYYNPQDVTVTLAHELGHYLGLYHVFSEDEDDTCKDTDYCEDTPSYNKTEYDSYYEWAVKGGVEQSKWFSALVQRTNCSGKRFTSTNLMDYEISYSNQFTADQRARVRHVLMYSPLIPGPKQTSRAASASAAANEPINLPIRTAK